MTERHKRNSRGALVDDVRTESLTASDLKAYRQAENEVGAASVPKLFNSHNPHARLYIVNFDGTGNDKDSDSAHATNVALIDDRLKETARVDSRIFSDYINGAGTQEGFLASTIDGATGRSYDERIEKKYLRFIDQAKAWIDVDPKADIRLMVTGFSRGAEQAAGFARLVHQRGIQDPDGRILTHQALGSDIVSWELPPLRAPGKTLMTDVLFDPVGTGAPNNYDRQPTSSTVSGLQISARDERRDAFPSTQIVPPGRSADGRFVGVTVPGAHSDIGGSYHQNGLSTMNFNIAADFINAHSDVPLVSRLPEPTDPSMYVIHHSEDHMWFYTTSEFDRDGFRDIMGAQAAPPHCREVIVCAPPDPFDSGLASVVGPRYPVHDLSAGVVLDMREPEHPDHGMFESARVHLIELQARTAADIEPDQIDRLAGGLVIEARSHGMTAIEDVKFGPRVAPGRPSLYAFPSYPGDPDDHRAPSVNIDVFKALEVPLETANERLHEVNHPKPPEIAQPAVAPPDIAKPAAEASQAREAAQARVVPPPTHASPETDAIRQLQQNLNTLGMRDGANNDVALTGVYDIATRTAVARFQSEQELPISGIADEATLATIQGEVFIADLQQTGEIRMPAQARVMAAVPPLRSTPEPSVEIPPGPAFATTELEVARSVAPSRDDPRHPKSPNHALYAEVQRLAPEASEDRLMQFTAACHTNGITADNMASMHFNEESLTLTFRSDSPLAMPAQVDMSAPPPPAAAAVEQIQQVDRQTDQIVQASQQRGAELAQQGAYI